ncbi:MAG: MerR family transcriptional regulator [Propionibacteriaceae bacterium]
MSNGGPQPTDRSTTAAPEAHLQIGVVADRLGLSIRTLRHWDEAGLVSPTARSSGGFRLYAERDVERLRTVRRMKPLGFDLEEMKQLLDALNTISLPDPEAADLGAAKITIAACRERAEESFIALEQRLRWAAEFRDLLAAIDA